MNFFHLFCFLLTSEVLGLATDVLCIVKASGCLQLYLHFKKFGVHSILCLYIPPPLSYETKFWTISLS